VVDVLIHSAVSLRYSLDTLSGLLHRKVELKRVNLRFFRVHATRA
jgi:hypothetical protein